MTPSLALSIRQPFSELIMLGLKTLEIRSQPTRVRGRVWLYASQKFDNECAALDMFTLEELDAMPRGVIVGSVNIVDCGEWRRRDMLAAALDAWSEGWFAWTLAEPKRCEPWKSDKHPQPVFWRP